MTKKRTKKQRSKFLSAAALGKDLLTTANPSSRIAS